MTYTAAIQLNAALHACSAPVTIVHEGKPVDVRPKLKGTALLSIAKAIVALKPVMEAWSAATKDIVKQHGGPWSSVAEAPAAAYAEANAEIMQLQAADAGVTITLAISESELENDDTHLSAGIIAELLPYLAQQP